MEVHAGGARARGKDLTLSGRTLIWSASTDAISDRPLTGYGIGGVWRDAATDPTAVMMRKIGFTVFHSHSTVLEVMLLLGAIGLALFLLVYVSAVSGAIKALDHDSALALGAPDPRRAVRALAVGSGGVRSVAPADGSHLCAHGASETSDRRQPGAGAEVGPRSRARPPLVVAVPSRAPVARWPSVARGDIAPPCSQRLPPDASRRAFVRPVAPSATSCANVVGRTPPAGAFARSVALSATPCTIASPTAPGAVSDRVAALPGLMPRSSCASDARSLHRVVRILDPAAGFGDHPIAGLALRDRELQRASDQVGPSWRCAPPDSPVVTSSVMPPTDVDTTGTPTAIASMIEIGSPSAKEGRQNTSLASSSAATRATAAGRASRLAPRGPSDPLHPQHLVERSAPDHAQLDPAAVGEQTHGMEQDELAFSVESRPTVSTTGRSPTGRGTRIGKRSRAMPHRTTWTLGQSSGDASRMTCDAMKSEMHTTIDAEAVRSRRISRSLVKSW